MTRLDNLSDAEFVFGALFYVAKKMDTLLDSALSNHNATSKQWFLLLIVSNLFSNPPTVKDVAREMGSSHQNVKQIALKLQEKGLLHLVKDTKDQRVTRLVLTENVASFWANVAPDGKRFMDNFYAGIDAKTIGAVRQCLSAIMSNLNVMDQARTTENE